MSCPGLRLTVGFVDLIFAAKEVVEGVESIKRTLIVQERVTALLIVSLNLIA
jgi:hypothetical protein